MMTFTVHKDAGINYDGTEIKEINQTLDTPFNPSPNAGLDRCCWVIDRGFFGKYIIYECIIIGIEFTNIWCYHTDRCGYIMADKLGEMIFEHRDLDKAITVCEEKNRRRKIKIVYK